MYRVAVSFIVELLYLCVSARNFDA